MTDVLEAYADRVKAMSRSQIEATLKSHDKLVGTSRWSRLDQGLRDRLERMAGILREALE